MNDCLFDFRVLYIPTYFAQAINSKRTISACIFVFNYKIIYITLIQNSLYQVSTMIWVISDLDVSEKGEKGGYIPYQVRLVTYLLCSVQWEWLMMISRYCELSRVNKPTTVWCYERKDTIGSKSFLNEHWRCVKNVLETRENIKIVSSSFYHIICGWFSWGSSKKKIFFWKKNPKWPIFKMAVFQNRQFSEFFCENFMDWSFG